jgi:hypothetical protein
MKKLSISMFATLAILLAVFSAFTTKPVFNEYEVWGITPQQISGDEGDFPSSTPYSSMTSNIQQTLYNSSSPLSSGSTDQEKLDNFVDSYKIAQELLQLCASRNDFICVAYVRTTATEVVLAVKEGDFDPE